MRRAGTAFTGQRRAGMRTAAVLCVLAVSSCSMPSALAQAKGGSAPHPQPARPAPRAGMFGQRSAPPLPKGEHLAQWMQQHNGLTPQQQQRALQKEPGFQQLPRETQQRMSDRLERLNSLPPEQRQRVLQRSEAMERLQPEQRAQVRSAMGQLGGLPQDRRRLVAKSFRDLRGLPPEQRNSILNSPEYRQQFSDEERGTLNNLLQVSPLLPPSR